MNINKLFPRLRISAKLAIAFVLIATLPLLIVGGIGMVSAVRTLRAGARSGVERDLGLAQLQTERGFRELEQHLTFLADIAFRQVLENGPAADSSAAAAIAASYLRADSTALQRVKLIDAGGRLRLVVQRAGSQLEPGVAGEAGEAFYAWASSQLGPGERAFVPIELRAVSDSNTGMFAPSVAVLFPLHTAAGEPSGVLVGEASAEVLFREIDASSPGLEGTTGLVDHEGLYLYHSTRKRDWSQLLSERSQVTLATDFGPVLAGRMLSMERGVASGQDGSVVGFRRVALGAGDRFLVLYRSVPLSRVMAPVRRSMGVFAVLGALVALTVLAAATVAARQITRPIYSLRHAAERIARGESPGALEVETNDELEDLARDFTAMAASLAQHRDQLEARVRERTRALRSTQAELSQVLTYSADAIVGADAENHIRVWNRGAERLFGYGPADVTGRPVEEVLRFGGDGNPAETIFLRRALINGEAVVNYRTVRSGRDGQPIAVSLTQSPILDERGVVAGSSLILRDDRAQQTLDEQMRRSERLAAISLMAAGLAHELNNPLAVLGNRIELMQRDASRNGGDRLRRDLEVLRQHVGRIGAITADLLRFARDDMDDLGPLDVNEVTQRVVRLVERMCVAAGLTLRSQLASELPQVQANASAVETVLVNLLLNAQQATPRGGTVIVRTGRGDDGDCVQVTVRDDGPGIPGHLRSRIFEPFFTTKSDRGGTGLGLAVCRALMDRQGGRIELGPDNGAGAVFALSFPLWVGSG